MFTRVVGFIVLCGLVSLSRAEDGPVITVRKGDRVSLSLSPIGGGSGGAVSKVLQHDLDLAGWFQLVPDAQASYLAGGTASGGSLQGKVTDRSGTVVLSKTYTGSDRDIAEGDAELTEHDTARTGLRGSWRQSECERRETRLQQRPIRRLGHKVQHKRNAGQFRFLMRSVLEQEFQFLIAHPVRFGGHD
jgi:hypothetical protein